MHNWSTDVKKLKKDKEAYAVWRLEQMINYGADGEKISEKELRACWKKLALDEEKKRFLGFLLWGRKYLVGDR